MVLTNYDKSLGFLIIPQDAFHEEIHAHLKNNGQYLASRSDWKMSSRVLRVRNMTPRHQRERGD